jgi:hypothetical protein
MSYGILSPLCNRATLVVDEAVISRGTETNPHGPFPSRGTRRENKHRK